MKTIKAIRVIIIILTTICGAYTAFAIYNLRGDKLLYYNSKTGYLLSVSYKWALLLFLILIAVNTLLALFLSKKKKHTVQTDVGEK